MRKHRIPKFRTFAICFLAAGAASGQSELQTQMPADLGELLRIATERNGMIRAADRRAAAADRLPDQAGALPRPILSYSRWLQSPETRVGPQEHAVTITQGIPFPGKQALRSNMARDLAGIAAATRDVVTADLHLQIKKTYFRVFSADGSIAILREYARLLTDFTEIASARYATGSGIQADVLTAQVELAEIEQRIIGRTGDRNSLVAKLAGHLQLDGAPQMAAITRLDTVALRLPLEALVDSAHQRRPELAMLARRLDRAGHALQLALKQKLPDFRLQGSWISVAERGAAPDAGKDAFAIMVGLDLPIWFGADRAAVQEAQEHRSAEEQTLAALLAQIRAEVSSAVFRAEAAQETWRRYAGTLLPQASSRLASALAAYRAGRVEFQTLIDAERVQLRLRLAEVEALASYRARIAELERATNIAFGGNR